MYDGSEWGLLPYVDPVSLTPITDNGTTFTNRKSAADASDYTNRDDLFLDVPIPERADTFKLLTSELTSEYDLTVAWNGVTHILTDEAADWEEGVYTPPSSFESLQYLWPGAEDDVHIGTGGTSKITATYDPDAPEIFPNLGKSFDIYLIPSLNSYEVITIRQEVGPPGTEYADVIVGNIVLYPRDVFYEPTHPMYGLVPRNMDGFWNHTDTDAEYYDNYYRAIYARDYVAQPGRARRRTSTDTNADTVYDNFVFEDLDLEDFPNTFWPAPPSIPSLTGTVNVSVSNVFSIPPALTRLQAVIRKSGNNYYVWKIV